ncbi:hypothetical protein [Halocola ammonii]
MKKIFAPIFTFALLLTSSSVFSQSDSLYTFEFQLRSSVGANVALTPVKKGFETDNLIGFQDNSLYWQIVSGTIYFNENWGLDASVFAYTSDNTYRLQDKFTAAVNEVYKDDYYILYNSAARDQSLEYQEFAAVRGFQAGLSYRVEKNERLIIQPRLLFGVMVFDNTNALVHLKERGTNTLKKVEYIYSRPSSNSFSASLGSMIGYNFHKGWILFAEVYYSYTYAGLEYTRETTDLYTEEVELKVYDHPNHLSSLKFGVGLAVDLKY